MLIHSYSPAGCKFISRLQPWFFLFTMWSDSPWPWGRSCWKNWCCVQLAQSSAADPGTSPCCRWLHSVFSCALSFGSLWLWGSHSLQCEFILLSIVAFHLSCLLKQTAWLHQTAAVTGHQLWWCSEYVMSSHLSPFLHDVSLGQQHWPFSLHGFMSENPFLKVSPLAFVEGETIVLSSFTVLTPLHL